MSLSEIHQFTNVSNLILGCGTFNLQYNDDPTTVPVKELLELARSSGINTLDTSPYYGPSEILIGQALGDMTWTRDELCICTKVGRVTQDVFDYSASSVRLSIMRSLQRLLGTSFSDKDPKSWYLDIVYLHDVEFQTLEQAKIALRELRSLQKEGYIHHVGISGYPLDYLYTLAKACCEDNTIGSLDCMLSYCNLNLQNTKLLDIYNRLYDECGIKQLANASVLSMSLLREQETRYFHPASKVLQECATKAAIYCKENKMDLANLAVKYSLTQWYNHGPTVIGFSNLEELQHSIRIYKEVIQHKENDHQVLTDRENEMIKHIQTTIFGSHFNETWPSGIHDQN